MPMNFPDDPSLVRAAQVHGFRPPQEGEPEEDFRQALADHVEPRDLVESMEIRTTHGWDQFTEHENRHMLMRHMMSTRQP